MRKNDARFMKHTPKIWDNSFELFLLSNYKYPSLALLHPQLHNFISQIEDQKSIRCNSCTYYNWTSYKFIFFI